jgi:hypothetical protein
VKISPGIVRLQRNGRLQQRKPTGERRHRYSGNSSNSKDNINYYSKRYVNYFDHSQSLGVKNERLGEALESLERAGRLCRTPTGWQRLD